MSFVCITEENGSLKPLSGKSAEVYAKSQYSWADLDLSTLTYPPECYTLVDGQAVEISDKVQEYTYKQGRASINTMTVTHPVSGRVYDADKEARDALTSAVTAGDPGESTRWRLADNTRAVVDWQELKEVLRLVGKEHTDVIAPE